MKFLKLFIISFLLIATSCKHNCATLQKLKIVDSLLYEESDSVAFSLLNSIKNEDLDTPEKANYYNLLNTGLKYRMDDHEQTDSTINRCVTFYEKAGDNEKLALSYYYRALVNWHTHSNDVLLDLKKAETHSSNTSNFGLMAKIYSALAKFNGGSMEFEKALSYSLKELETAKRSGKKWLAVYAHTNLSITYESLNNFDSAYYHALQSETYVQGLPFHHKAYIYNILGLLLVGENDSLAESYLKKSLECEPLPQTYTSLAEIYNAQGNWQAAENMWNKAVDRAWPELKTEIFEAKATFEYSSEEYAECCNTLRAKEKALTEFYESKLKNKALELENKYDLDLYKHQVRSRIIIASVVAVLAIVVLVFVHRIRLRRIENRRIASELHYEKSKNMLARLEEQISILEKDKKNKLNELAALKEKAQNLKAGIMQNLQRGHDLYDKLNHCESIVDWSDFDVFCLLDFVSTINQDFAFSLENDYDDLNTSQKLFLVVSDLMGKKEHEICQMFGLEKQSLRNKRNRIEKKRISAA